MELKCLKIVVGQKEVIGIDLACRAQVMESHSFTSLKDTVSQLRGEGIEMSPTSKSVSAITAFFADGSQSNVKDIGDFINFKDPSNKKMDFNKLLNQITDGELYYIRGHLMRANSPNEGYHEPFSIYSLPGSLRYCHDLATALYDIFLNGYGRQFKQFSSVTQLGGFIFVEHLPCNKELSIAVLNACERVASVMNGYAFINRQEVGTAHQNLCYEHIRLPPEISSLFSRSAG